jgi:hypothetical protein
MLQEAERERREHDKMLEGSERGRYAADRDEIQSQRDRAHVARLSRSIQPGMGRGRCAHPIERLQCWC